MSDKNSKQLAIGNLKANNTSVDKTVDVPVAIMKRVNALKNLQLELLDIESKFYEELHHLECKYAKLYDPLFDRRSKIINGEYEPTEKEAKWELDDEDVDMTGDMKALENKMKPVSEDKSDLSKDLTAKATLSDIGSGATDMKGVPEFWLQTFKCVELIGEMIQEYDEPILKQLKDVRVRMHDQKPYGYTLEFEFNDNEFFSNKVLTKTYELRTEYDPKDPFSYEGPDLYKCKGCTIDWKKGKNVTVRLIKKKQKHKGHGTIRVVTKELKQDSFFNYFDTPSEEEKSTISSSTEDGKKAKDAAKEHDDDESEKDDSLFAADFEIGHFFKERVIPKAVLYFTGEIADDECYEDYEDEEDEDDDGLDQDDDDENSEGDDDDDDDDDDEDHNKKDTSHNKKGGNKHQHGKGKNASNKQAEGNNPPECKQN